MLFPRIHRLSLFLPLLAGMVWFAPSAGAQEGDTDAAVQDARESLGGRGSFPWYDREADAPRPIRLRTVEDDTTNRSSNWQPAKSTITGPPPNLSFLGRMLQVMGIAALVALLVLAVILITRAFLRGEVMETAGSKVVETSHDVDRVEHLPFQLRKPAGDFLDEARRLYEAGDYSQAILYLYSHFLVQLDRQHVIRLAKGKTNRQYLRETRPRPILHEVLEVTMVSFEDVFFGHHKLSREQFEASWNRLADFEAELSRVERAAA
jgi:hypothetical protein